MYKFMRKYGIAVIALCIVAAFFATGFICGRCTVSAQMPQAAQGATNTDDSTTTAATDAGGGTGTTVPTVTTSVYAKCELQATAYCHCEKCCGVWATKRPTDDNGKPIVYTASGTVAQAGRTVAADTSVFPFGTVLIINGIEYVVEDRGGGIKGNRIDIYFDDHNDALQFGRQTLTAQVKLENGKGADK